MYVCVIISSERFSGHPKIPAVTTGFRFDNTEDFYWAKV